MKPETEDLVVRMLRMDDSIPQDLAEVALRILRGERKDALADDPLNMPPLLYREEIAAKLRISKQTVSNWAKCGRLDVVKNKRGQTIGYTPESFLAVRRGER